MPVRFQVDPDFYDHPKSIDLSDAAVALWTRAGSYSVAKLLDGFVPDAMLARLSKTADEASQELMRQGLWRRTKGGFQFHQWKERNPLTRARIEADREYERDKKRRQRGTSSEGSESSNTQASGTDVSPPVPPGHLGDTTGTPPGVPTQSDSDSDSDSDSSKNTPRKRGRVTDDDPDFAEFWDAYPRRVDKGHARKAWAARIADGAKPRAIIDGAVRYRDDPRRPREDRFIPHPSTWLNGERWTDSTEVTPPPLFSDDRWWDN